MKKMFIHGITAFVCLTFFSCTGLQDLSQQSVNGRKIEYAATMNGKPTIVFETGLGSTILTWDTILDSIKGFAGTFVYNRPGYGSSSFVNAPQTVREVAEQLNQNLLATGQKPPYILVGHSAGGLYINMYARLYPEKVAGVVFIDSSHPDQFEYFRKEQRMMYNMLLTSTSKGKRRYESSIVQSTHLDFKNAPAFPDVPVTVLTAGKKSSFLENDKMRKKWIDFQSDLAALSSNSKHIIVKGSGHFIHRNKPELVIREIKKMALKQTTIK